MADFFKSDSERQLWIKLNAERIQHSERIVNHRDLELGDINKPYSPMWVSNNQLEYDEANREAPRFSFEEFLTLSPQDLLKLGHDRNAETIRKLFESFKINEDNL